MSQKDKTEVAETFKQAAIVVLRRMLESGETESVLDPESFPHLKVVIGESRSDAVTVIEVPDDLREQVTGNVYVVRG